MSSPTFYISQNNWYKFFFLIFLLVASILPMNTIFNENITSREDKQTFTNNNIKEIVSNNLNSFMGGFIENVNQKSVNTKFFLQSKNLAIDFSQSSMKMVTLGQHSQVALLNFAGSNNVSPIGINKLDTINNYFIGSNMSNWSSSHYFEQIVYKNIYNNIDLYYQLQNGKLKYEFYVYPGADINDIQLKWSKSVNIEQNSNGMLIRIGSGSLGNQFSFLDTNPLNYNSETRNQEVPGTFKTINDQTYGFNIPNYDKDHLLIIDPSIVEFGTYVSGSLDDNINAMVLDSFDNIYVTGYSKSVDFPVSSDAFNSTYDGLSYTYDAFLFKLSANGSKLLYSSYIAGNNGNEYGRSVVLDSTGNIYITGSTSSPTFPVTSNAMNKTYNGGTDAFIMKFAPNGSTLLYSTYLGGTGEEQGYSIAVDSQNNMYIAGNTKSVNFPTKNAYNATFGGTSNGNSDGFVVKLNANGQSLNYSTYLGGTSYENVRSIKVDNYGFAYITGDTYSSDFPTTPNAYDKVLSGPIDIFVTKMSLDGTMLNYSTHLASTADSYDVAIDTSGNAFISGNSWSGSYYSLAVYELAANGSTVLHSKVMSAGGNTYGQAISLDNYGNIYVGGQTQGASFQTTSDAVDSTGDPTWSDGFIVKLNPDFTVAYSSYFGGTSYDSITSISADSKGNIIVAGSTNTTDFPVTLGSYNTTGDNASTYDGFIASINLQPETVPPFLVGPSDLTYESGITGNILNWTVGDVHPGTYTVTKNGSVVGSTYNLWTNGTISINVDALSVGSYLFNITVYDGAGNSASDTVIVTVVDTTVPSVTSPADKTYESGSIGNIISWTIGDVNPSVYSVTRNGTSLGTNSWTNKTINLQIDGLSIGTYEFTITVYDEVGNSASDTIIVTVIDSIVPSVTNPTDITYELGSTGHTIIWTIGDVNPDMFTITSNGVTLETVSWTNETISLSINSLPVGSYEYNITVYDSAGNYIVDTVIVTVIDTISPVINGTTSLNYQFGSTGNNLEWTVGDIDPGVYNVTMNGTVYTTITTWTNGTISVKVDNLAIGIYNFTIFLYDSSGNVATTTAIVEVTSNPTSSTAIASSTIPSTSQGFEQTSSTSTNNASFGGFLPVFLALISLGVLLRLTSIRKKKK